MAISSAPGGLQINLTYSLPSNSAPAGFKPAVQLAASQIVWRSHRRTNISVNIQVGYGTLSGITMSNQTVSESEMTSFVANQSYATFLAEMTAMQKTPEMTSIVATLPAGTSIQGTSSLFCPYAFARIIGLAPAVNGLN